MLFSLPTAGTITIGDYVDTDKYLDVQFEGFYSKLDILMYYVAVSDYKNITATDCRNYVSIWNVSLNVGIHKDSLLFVGRKL